MGTTDDIATVATIRANAATDSLITPEGMTRWLSTLPEMCQLQLVMAEADGRVVGFSAAMRYHQGTEPDSGMLDVIVEPDRQGRGLGHRLARAGLDHLADIGVRTLQATSIDGPAERAFATAHGFVEMQASSKSAVDPRTIAPLPIPPGVSVRSFGEIEDPRPLYDLFSDASQDVPGEGDFDSMTFEQRREHYWRNVWADDEASLAAYVDAELAALTIVRVHRPSHRAQNDLTATRRTFRGRGLAQLIKSHSLHRAAEAGATIAYTNNHEANPAILAVNHKLGYRHSSRRIEWERRDPPR